MPNKGQHFYRIKVILLSTLQTEVKSKLATMGAALRHPLPPTPSEEKTTSMLGRRAVDNGGDSPPRKKSKQSNSGTTSSSSSSSNIERNIVKGEEAVESLTTRGKRSLTAILAGRREELGYDNGG